MNEKETTMMMVDNPMDSNLNFKCEPTTAGEFVDNKTNLLYEDNQLTGWKWWTDYYYPQIIRESYPVYLRERAEDKGKKAYEIVKVLADKKLVNIETGKDFIKIMDTIIEML